MSSRPAKQARWWVWDTTAKGLCFRTKRRVLRELRRAQHAGYSGPVIVDRTQRRSWGKRYIFTLYGKNAK